MNSKRSTSNSILTAYESATQQYSEFGIDTDKVIEQLKEISISIHYWQGDDVGGFERPDTKLSGGGIQATGNYLGKARTIKELQMDFEKAISLIPGNHRMNLQSSYGDFGGKIVERNEFTPEHFQGWIEWARDKNLKLDFNCTLFSHPKADDGFTLSCKSKETREFWIEHVKKCREISAEIGKQLNDRCIHNIWIPDGMKDIPVDRIGHRKLLRESLDDILNKKYPQSQVEDSLEGKLFGIGSESFVVGSHEFYLSYAIANNTLLTIDTGHYHPTESAADKISAVLPFLKGLMLHVSRGLRWDSDHVVILNDDLIQLAEEVVRCRNMDKINIGLDFFDASINRIAAWVIGTRAMQKSLLYALLQPIDRLMEYENNGEYFKRLGLLEDLKSYPHGAIWDYFCLQNDVPVRNEWMEEIEQYEQNVLKERI